MISIGYITEKADTWIERLFGGVYQCRKSRHGDFEVDEYLSEGTLIWLLNTADKVVVTDDDRILIRNFNVSN